MINLITLIKDRLDSLYPDADPFERGRMRTLVYFFSLVEVVLVAAGLLAIINGDFERRYGIQLALVMVPFVIWLALAGKESAALYLAKSLSLVSVSVGIYFGGGHYVTSAIPVIFFLFYGTKRSTIYVTVFMLVAILGNVALKHSFSQAALARSIGPLITLPVIGYLCIVLKGHLDHLLVRLTVAVNQTSSAVVMTALNGDIEYTNSAFNTMTGYSSAECNGANIRMLKSGQHSAEYYANLWSAIIDGKTWKGEFLNRRKDGSSFWTRSVISPVILNNRMVSYMAVSEDITEEKRQQLLHRSVNKIMRHDLKAPLSSIMGFPRLLLDQPNLTDEQKKMVQYILNGAIQMRDQIDASLTLYQLEAGSYKGETSMVNLLELLDRLKEQLTEAGNMSGQSMSIEALESIDGQVSAKGYWLNSSQVLLNSILRNLLLNALEAGQEGDRVEVKLDMKNGAVITVHNAAPVSARMRGVLFNKYTTDKKNATGLGLYSARLMCQAIGAVLSFTSSETDGTTFNVCLPGCSERPCNRGCGDNGRIFAPPFMP